MEISLVFNEYFYILFSLRESINIQMINVSYCTYVQYLLQHVVIVRAHLHQASAKMLRQLCNDTSDSVLIKINGDT